MIGTTILLFAYALLIPAPRGRAWQSIAAIAAFPVAAEVLLFLAHPEVFRLARQVANLSAGRGRHFPSNDRSVAGGIWCPSREHHADQGA